jgi:hypothetical protein
MTRFSPVKGFCRNGQARPPRDGFGDLQGDAGGREVLAGIVASRLLRVDDDGSGRQLVGDQMVVRDDHRDALRARAGNALDRRDPAVHRHDHGGR